MDQQFLSLSLILSSILFILMVLRLWKGRNLRAKLPPGPRKLPIIGNLHSLVGDIPHRRLRDLALKHGPLMHLQLGEVDFIIVSSKEIAEQVMKVHDINFASRPHSLGSDIVFYKNSDMVFLPYGEYWRKLRKVCIMELLSARRVQQFRPIREEEVSKVVKALASNEGRPVNLSRMLYTSSYSIIARILMGRKAKDDERYIEITEKIVNLFAGFSVVDVFPSIKLLPVITGVKSKFENIHREADAILETIIGEHKAVRESCGPTEIEEDLVHVLLNLQKNGGLDFDLTNENIKGVIQDLILGGLETSSSTVEWAISELLKNPQFLHKAQAEVRQVFGEQGKINEADFSKLEYLSLVIKETLRMHAPLPLCIPREGGSCEINGYHIPAKAKTIVNAWAIGRDPNHWSEPDTFNPERFKDSSFDFKGTNFQFIPFGAGRRICPGVSFGLANVELTLAHLLYHFDFGMPDGKTYEDLDMNESFGSAVRRKCDLYVVPSLHKVSST